LILVVHPAAADVQRPADRLDVEPAEAQPALGVLIGPQAARRPGVHRGLRDLAVDLVAGRCHHLPHPLEMLVGAVDVPLLAFDVRVAHASKLAAVACWGPKAGFSCWLVSVKPRGLVPPAAAASVELQAGP